MQKRCEIKGAVLSPLLFCLYMNVLLCKLHVSCHFGDRFCGALCYADDLTLLAPSKTAIVMLLDVCESFALEFSVKYNASKSVYLCCNDRNSSNPGLCINGSVIKPSKSAIHLDHCIGPLSETEFVLKGKNNS